MLDQGPYFGHSCPLNSGILDYDESSNNLEEIKVYNANSSDEAFTKSIEFKFVGGSENVREIKISSGGTRTELDDLEATNITKF
jgi:hypothetical protein